MKGDKYKREHMQKNCLVLSWNSMRKIFEWGLELMDNREEWERSRDRLVAAIRNLGFPGELGEEIAKQLGSPKAMDRMMGYLYNVKPQSAELIVDEMLAICSDIDRWREKKANEEANIRYNELLYYGLEDLS